MMTDTRLFFKTVIPSIIAFALSGVYTIVDGLFLGNSLGDIGLACITLGYPITAFIQATGTGIGLSGAIRFTILRSQEKRHEAENCFKSTVFLLGCASAVVTIGILLNLPMLLVLLGAKGESLTLTAEYISVIALGAVCQIFATGLVPFIRNLGGSTFAMFAMIIGFLLNGILDYYVVFLYNWGMAGAALATVIGQFSTALLAIGFIVRKRLSFSVFQQGLLAHWGAILKLAVAPFGVIFATQITAIFMNQYLMAYGNEQAVAVYGCIAYMTAIVYLLLQGIGDGSQPLISLYFGQKHFGAMKHMRRLAYLTSLGVSLACLIALYTTSGMIGTLFGTSLETNQAIARYLPLFLIPLLGYAYVRMTIAFLYATAKSFLAYVLVFAEPLLIIILLNGLAPLHALGIWISIPLAQLLTFSIALLVKYRVDKSSFR